MTTIRIKPARRLEGEIYLPGDKSISHRSIMISSLAEGTTRISNFLQAEDCECTREAFHNLGVEIVRDREALIVVGKGRNGLKEPAGPLYLGNSGTTMRLLLGILAGQNFCAILGGDESLSRRPMRRVTMPLRQMGAEITGRGDADHAPLTICGGRIKAMSYRSPVASAQVKSALLFAGLYPGEETTVTEPVASRDHTERMLKLFGAQIAFSLEAAGKAGPNTVRIKGGRELAAPREELVIPGDISSAAFFLVGAAILPGSHLVIRNAGINPTRSFILEVLRNMGAEIQIVNQVQDYFEPRADIIVRSSELKGVTIGATEAARLIDELPVLAVAASYASGTTEISGAGELRVKETDRIDSICTNLGRMGVDISSSVDGLFIKGGEKPTGASLDSYGDHRTAMCGVIAGLGAEGETYIKDTECIATSFPGFMDTLESVIVR